LGARNSLISVVSVDDWSSWVVITAIIRNGSKIFVDQTITIIIDSIEQLLIDSLVAIVINTISSNSLGVDACILNWGHTNSTNVSVRLIEIPSVRVDGEGLDWVGAEE